MDFEYTIEGMLLKRPKYGIHDTISLVADRFEHLTCRVIRKGEIYFYRFATCSNFDIFTDLAHGNLSDSFEPIRYCLAQT